MELHKIYLHEFNIIFPLKLFFDGICSTCLHLGIVQEAEFAE